MSSDGAGLVALRKACVPREDVLHGGLDDNHFAAQLDKVVRDAAHYPVYGDATEFFAQTYPAAGLKTLLTKTFGRVSGVKGIAGESGVLRPTTSFGGGKTHALTAVYHLAKGARPANLDEFLDPGLLPDVPVQVAAIVGDVLDPVAGLETNGHRAYTLWGEMGAQLGESAFTVLAANDEARTAPGTETIKAAFGGEPTIVIIDEIAKYIRNVTASGSEDVRRMARTVPVFIANLLEVASDPSNRVAVIITLASTTNAFGAETTEIGELLDEAQKTADAASAAVATETGDVLARAVQPSAIIKPAEDNEIGEILKKRLFASVDQDVATQAGEAYRALYETLKKTEHLDGGPERPTTYGELVAKSYPFHPELVRVLDQRLGSIAQFQRARGALKLLAEVVSRIYKTDDDVAIINVGDIDYSNEPVLNHLTEGLGRGEYASVARGDFAGPNSHAAAVDQEVFPGKPAYATRVARTVFTHSLEMVATAGAGRNDWIIGTLRPGEDAAIFEKALTESEAHFWHLSYDGARWRFNVEPNVNAIIESEKRNVAKTAVAAMVDSLITGAFSNEGGVTVLHFPGSPADIPDQSSLRVVVLDYRVITVSAKIADTPPSMVLNMLEKVGSVGTPRKFRNSVVFVLPDNDQVAVLEDRARTRIAADNLAADTARLTQFSEQVRQKVEQYQKQATLDARIAVSRCYKHVYYPYDDRSAGYLRHRELPTQAQGDPKNSTSAVLRLLEDEGKIRNDPFSAAFLRTKTWPNKPSSTTTAIIDFFWTDYSLQMVRNPTLVREAIIAGIKNEGWVYYDGGTGKSYTAHTMAGMNVEFANDTEVMTGTEAQTRGLLVRKPTQADLRAVLTADHLTGAEVRSRLEAECGGEPSKTDVLDLLATALQGSDYTWFVVLDIEPAAGVRALPPSQVKDRGLDTLLVLTRAEADRLGVEVPTRTATSKTFTATGPGGAAFQRIIDQVSDFTVQTISRLTIKVAADEASGMGDVDLAVAALGMLQKQNITVKASVVAEYKGLAGGLTFRGSAERQDFQTAYNHAKKALAGATKLAGDLTLELAFDPPADVAGSEVSQVHTVIKNLQITNTAIAAEVTK